MAEEKDEVVENFLAKVKKNQKYRKINRQKKYCTNEYEDGNQIYLCQDCDPVHLVNFYHQFRQPPECPDGVLCTNFFYDKCPYSHDVPKIKRRGCKYGAKCRLCDCPRQHPQGTHKICKDGAECPKVKIGVNYDAKHVEEYLHPSTCISHKNTPCKYGAKCQDKNCEYLHATKSFDEEQNDDLKKYVHVTTVDGKEIVVEVSKVFSFNQSI
jgi:hypothetical protein